jgi:hypothetical protein
VAAKQLRGLVATLAGGLGFSGFGVQGTPQRVAWWQQSNCAAAAAAAVYPAGADHLKRQVNLVAR